MFTNDTTNIGFLGNINNHDKIGFILGKEDEKVINSLPDNSALLISKNPFSSGSRFLLDEDEVMVGRSMNADIFLDDPTVSREHAKFVRIENGYKIIDNESLNGTYLNGEQVSKRDLKTGDQLQIGKYKFMYFTRP